MMVDLQPTLLQRLESANAVGGAAVPLKPPSGEVVGKEISPWSAGLVRTTARSGNQESIVLPKIFRFLNQFMGGLDQIATLTNQPGGSLRTTILTRFDPLRRRRHITGRAHLAYRLPGLPTGPL